MNLKYGMIELSLISAAVVNQYGETKVEMMLMMLDLDIKRQLICPQ